ncbi:MAG: hypothetical protein K1X94_27290 [Sandaracinaceae bacterium]|nr:hypothetical protein [Sandaracinaceae bacterium]
MTKKGSLSQEDIATGRTMSRRAMTLLGGIALGAASSLGAVGCCFGSVPTSGSGCSDRDPTDGIGRGTHCTSTGCSDSDPTDPAGGGRSCGGAVPTPTAPTPTPPPTPAAPPGTKP